MRRHVTRILRAVLAAAVLAATALAAAPAGAATQAIFAGMFVVTSASKSCASLLGSTRTMFFSTTVYGNGRAQILVTDAYQTLTLAPEGKSFAAAGPYEGTQIDRWNGVSTWSASYSGFKFEPAKIGDKTESVTITGRIKALNQDKSCTVGFRAVGVRT